jgi:hypothetical protein
MMRTLIATAAATLFAAATVLFGAGVAKADCYTSCYQNGTQYQCDTSCT